MTTLRMFILLALAVVCASLSGCAGYLAPRLGAVAGSEAQVELIRGGKTDVVLQTSDLAMIYSFHEEENNFILKGKLLFDGSVTNSFGTIKHFNIRMSFLDGEGRVIESINITPFYRYMAEIPDPMVVNVSHPKPAGSQAIAFNYSGVFKMVGEEKIGDEWNISYFPYN